jgi:hypothetical protein
MKIAVSGYKCLNDINEFVETKNITLITGKNSSGKSSFSEVFEFYLKFSNLAKNKSSFIEWFDISVDSNTFANINKFYLGLSEGDKVLHICIDKIKDLQLKLKFKFDESGFFIRLDEINVLTGETVILTVAKDRKIENTNNKYFHLKNKTNEYKIQTNINECLKRIFPLVQESLKCYHEFYLESQQNTIKDYGSFSFDKEKFIEWFDTVYMYPEFIKNLELTNNKYSTNHKYKLDQNEYDTCIRSLELHKDIFLALSDIKAEKTERKLLFAYINFRHKIHEKFRVNYFDHFKRMLTEEKLQKQIKRICLIKNFEFITKPKTGAIINRFLSKNEINDIKQTWKNLANQTVEYYYTYSKENKVLREFKDSNNRKFVDGININGNLSYFPMSNLPGQTFFENFYWGSNRENSKNDNQINIEDKSGKKIIVNSIYEGYLKLMHLAENIYIENTDEYDSKNGEEIICVSNNDLLFVTSICYEQLGLILTNNLFKKNETETTSIHGNDFHDMWNKLNNTQRISFQNTFEKIQTNGMSLNDVLSNLTDGLQITFPKNNNYGTVDIIGNDETNNQIGLNFVGMGHANIVNIILEINLQITKAIHSGKTALNLILVEPEKYSHPNLISKITNLIYYFSQLPNFEFSRVPNFLSYPRINFIIETHSEYLIRSFQARIAELNNSNEKNYVNLNDSLTINYFEKKSKTNCSKIRQIYIENDGSLSDEFGSGFLDETELIIRNILNSRKQ